MTTTTTPGFGFPISSANDDQWPARAGWGAILQLIESKALRFAEGLAVDRPAAPAPGLVWRNTATGEITWYVGGAWRQLVPAGGAAAASHTHTPQSLGAVPSLRQIVTARGVKGGGTLAGDLTLEVDFAGSGLSEKAARADHTHAAVTPWYAAFPLEQARDQPVEIPPTGTSGVGSWDVGVIPAGRRLDVAGVAVVQFIGTNAACWVHVLINGGSAGRRRFHSHNRGAGIWPVPFAGKSPSDGTAIQIAIRVDNDPLSTGNVNVYEISGQLTVE